MRLYSTLQREKVELPPPPGPIRMYFCGPTVYARAHVGNARPFVLGMWLRNWLRSRGYDVTLVHNITDINDKIYRAAEGGSSAELAERATRWYLEDVADLGLGLPDQLPKATESIPHTSGRTTGCSSSQARRCRNPRGTSSRSATPWNAGDARRCSCSS